ncbi:MAG: hypothetical protein GY841_15845 [FCB group bacterium]|nr:hypothetical protein [FCB group bacterium]
MKKTEFKGEQKIQSSEVEDLAKKIATSTVHSYEEALKMAGLLLQRGISSKDIMKISELLSNANLCGSNLNLFDILNVSSCFSKVSKEK